MAVKNFIDITLTKDTLDLYYHRKAIFNNLQKNLPFLTGKLLDTACGAMPYREYILSNSSVTKYIGLDIVTARNYSDTVKPDVTWTGETMPFETNSFECAIATEVLEHVPEPINFLSETYRVLKPGGVFFFTVPFLWPLHEPPHDEYRYTPFALERLLSSAGFLDITLTALGGWNASLGQMVGLWVRRSPMPPRTRRVLKTIALPFVRYLYNHDNPTPDFYRGPMITGLCGRAYKK